MKVTIWILNTVDEDGEPLASPHTSEQQVRDWIAEQLSIAKLDYEQAGSLDPQTSNLDDLVALVERYTYFTRTDITKHELEVSPA